jgi:hypothetical protein
MDTMDIAGCKVTKSTVSHSTSLAHLSPSAQRPPADPASSRKLSASPSPRAISQLDTLNPPMNHRVLSEEEKRTSRKGRISRRAARALQKRQEVRTTKLATKYGPFLWAGIMLKQSFESQNLFEGSGPSGSNDQRKRSHSPRPRFRPERCRCR